MSRLSWTRALGALLMLLPPAIAALEVGPLQVSSEAGQPLQAEIAVTGNAVELANLSAQIASAEVYARAGYSRGSFLAGIVVTLDHGAADRAVIQLRSGAPVPAGQSLILLDLRWPGGGLVRGYPFALDGTPIAAAASAEPKPTAPPPPPVTPTAKPAAPLDMGSTYHTQPGDTLGSIAQRSGPPGGVARRAAAIQALNPEHFENGDPNRLRAGVILRLPTDAEVAAQEAPPPREEPAPAATQPPAEPGRRLRIGTGRADPNAPGERLLTLEESLATQSRIADERDQRIRSLEETVHQLSTLLVLQQQQLAALGASAPAAHVDADARPLAIAHQLGAPTRRDSALPWYRRAWVQAAVVGFALTMFVLLAISEAHYRIQRKRRRARRKASQQQL